MKPWLKTLLLGLAELVLIVVFYQVVLQEVLARETVSSILAAGDHVPRSTMALALAFLALRALVVLALPGMILSRIGLALFDAAWAPRRPRETGDGMADQ